MEEHTLLNGTPMAHQNMYALAASAASCGTFISARSGRRSTMLSTATPVETSAVSVKPVPIVVAAPLRSPPPICWAMRIWQPTPSAIPSPYRSMRS